MLTPAHIPGIMVITDMTSMAMRMMIFDNCDVIDKGELFPLTPDVMSGISDQRPYR